MIINKKQIIVQVHPGMFHPDDVLCVAMLMDIYGKENINIVRDANIHPEADYILDVGNINRITYKDAEGNIKYLTYEEAVKNNNYNVQQIMLDHHILSPASKEYKEADLFQVHKFKTIDYKGEDIKIRHCAASLLFELISRDNNKSEKENENFKKNIIIPTAICDNGQDYYQFGLTPYDNELGYVYNFNPTWLEEKEGTDPDKIFRNICELTANALSVRTQFLSGEPKLEKSILERYEIIYTSNALGEKRMNEILSDKPKNIPYILLDSGALRWKYPVVNFNEDAAIFNKVYFCIYKDKGRDQYVLRSIPINERTKATIIPIPETILENAECVFRHEAGHMASFTTLKAAENAADILYTQYIKDHPGYCNPVKNTEYLVGDFSNEQIWEIRYGIESEVSVEIYANPEYSAFHMNRIRKALKDELDKKLPAEFIVESVLKGYDFRDYSKKQIYQFQRGLQDGLEYDKIMTYMDPELTTEEMKEIRDKLTEELDKKPIEEKSKEIDPKMKQVTQMYQESMEYI